MLNHPMFNRKPLANLFYLVKHLFKAYIDHPSNPKIFKPFYGTPNNMVVTMDRKTEYRVMPVIERLRNIRVSNEFYHLETVMKVNADEK